MNRINPRHPAAIASVQYGVRVAALTLLYAAAVACTASDMDSLTGAADVPVLTRCETILTGGLKTDTFWPSMHAAEGLTALGRQDIVLGRLSAQLPETTDPKHRVGVARELVRAGDTDKLDVIVDALRDRHSAARVHAAETLFKLGETGDAHALHVAMRQGEDPGLRAFAAAALAQADRTNTDALNALRASLDHPDVTTRRFATFCLGLLRDQASAPLLKRNAERSDADSPERAHCMQALAVLGDRQGLADLASQLVSETASVRASAAMTTGLAGVQELRPRLIRLLDDPEPDVRIRAAHALVLLSQNQISTRSAGQRGPGT